MSNSLNVSLDFLTGEGGTAENSQGYSLDIMKEGGSAKPYDLLFMALGSCMYATFEEVFKKMKLNCESTSIAISGVKREEVPKFLMNCSVKFTVKAADKPDRFKKAFDLACKYCSIFQTLSKVAEMNPEIDFIEA